MTTKPDLKFDHDPRAASPADCPSAKCADRSRRLAWVKVDASPLSYEAFHIDLTDVHFSTVYSGGMAELTIYSPTDELLEALVLAATGEIARRSEARAKVAQ